MLDKIQRQQRFVEQDAKNAMMGNTKDTVLLPGSDGEDAMGVYIGDTVHNHYGTDTAQQPAQANTTNWMKNAALAAALLASGTGLGAWAMTLLQQPAPHEFTDTDTIAVPAAVQIYGTDKE